MAISSVQASISVVCQLLLWLPFIQCTNSKAPTTNTRSIETLAATSDIHLAALKNDVQQLELLISQGKDVNARLRSTDTPLLLATSRGNVASVETLLRLAKSSIDVNIQDKHGTSALHVAVMRREEKIVKLLLSAFAEVNIKDKDDKTPLHHAIYTSEIVERSFRGNQHTIVHLLLLHGANPNMRDVQGSTPLLYAASAGSVGDTLILLKFGSDVNLRNFRGLTALHMAAAYGHRIVIEILLDHKADPRPMDAYGRTAASMAIEEQHSEIGRILLEEQRRMESIEAQLEEEEEDGPVKLTYNGKESRILDDVNRFFQSFFRYTPSLSSFLFRSHRIYNLRISRKTWTTDQRVLVLSLFVIPVLPLLCTSPSQPPPSS